MKEFPAETCANCGRTIGRLEPAMVHRSGPGQLYTVCAQCHALLSTPPTTAPTPTEHMASTTSSAAAVTPQAGAPTNYSKGIFWLLFWLFIGGPLLAVGLDLLFSLIYSIGNYR